MLVWLSVATVAAAHAELVSSVPAKGSTVPASSAPIVLTFSEGMQPTSHADLLAPSGAKLGTATVDPADTTKLTFTPGSPLDPGVWTVKWTSIALDGHLLRDQYTFTVSAAASPAPSASTTSIASPTATPSPTPSPSGASATGASVLLPVLAAIIVIAVLALVLLRNRRPTTRR